MEDLESAVCLAELQHFGRAAEQLGISQPALTARIRRLELKLGVVLFTRGRHGARPTSAGVAYVEVARHALATAAKAARAAVLVHAGHGQPVAVGVTPIASQLFAAALLQQWRIDVPDLALSIHEGSTRRLERLLDEGTLDVAMLLAPLHAQGLQHLALCTHDVRAATRRPLPAGRTSLDIGAIVEAGLISYQRAAAPSIMANLSSAADRAGRSWEPGHVAETATAAIVLASAGFGVALVPAGMSVPAGVHLHPVSGYDERPTSVLAWRRANRHPVLARLLDSTRAIKLDGLQSD